MNARVSTRKNAAMIRHEAQCQARYRRNVFVTGLVLGCVMTWGMLAVAHRIFESTAHAVASNPLVTYAHAKQGTPDSSLPRDQSPNF